MASKFTPVKNWIDEIEKRINKLEGTLTDKNNAKIPLNNMFSEMRSYEAMFENASKIIQEEIDEYNLFHPSEIGNFDIYNLNFMRDYNSTKKDYHHSFDHAKFCEVDTSGLPRELNYLEILN